MSIVSEKLKKYWGAFLAGFIFLLLGVITVLGVIIWSVHTNHNVAAYGIVVLGILIGILEIFESYRLLKIPFTK